MVAINCRAIWQHTTVQIQYVTILSKHRRTMWLISYQQQWGAVLQQISKCVHIWRFGDLWSSVVSIVSSYQHQPASIAIVLTTTGIFHLSSLGILLWPWTVALLNTFCILAPLTTDTFQGMHARTHRHTNLKVCKLEKWLKSSQ